MHTCRKTKYEKERGKRTFIHFYGWLLILGLQYVHNRFCYRKEQHVGNEQLA